MCTLMWKMCMPTSEAEKVLGIVLLGSEGVCVMQVIRSKNMRTYENEAILVVAKEKGQRKVWSNFLLEQLCPQVSALLALACLCSHLEWRHWCPWSVMHRLGTKPPAPYPTRVSATKKRSVMHCLSSQRGSTGCPS